MTVQTDFYIPELKKAEQQISLQAAEIERLREALKGAAVVTNTAASEIAKLREQLGKRTSALEIIAESDDGFLGQTAKSALTDD